MSIDAWADKARRSQYRKDAEHQRAITTLKTVFEGKETPVSAASTIASTYEPVLKRGFQLSPVNELWGMICEAATILGGNQDIDQRLISLLNSISSLPDVLDEKGDVVKAGPYGDYGVYWKDLPSLAIMFREYAIDIEPETSEMPDEGEWTDAQKAKLMNVITFSALYLTHGHKDIGMSFHAEVGLMEAIEVSYETLEQQRRAATVVPPAATWILLAGVKIHELCKSGKDDKGRGFSIGRWAFWKEKFSEIATNQASGDDVRNIASKAVSEMERIERCASDE